jgi:hypothetical protein
MKKYFFLIIMIFNSLWSSEWKGKEYRKDLHYSFGHQGIWSESGLSGGVGFGGYSQKKCSEQLFQWRGKGAYQYNPAWSGGGEVQIFGGLLSELRAVSNTRYILHVKRWYHDEPLLNFLGLSLSLDQASFSSVLLKSDEEDIKKVCQDFFEYNGAGLAVRWGGLHRFSRGWNAFSVINLGMSYRGRIRNEFNLGISKDVHHIFPNWWRELGAMYLHSELLINIQSKVVALNVLTGISVLF